MSLPSNTRGSTVAPLTDAAWRACRGSASLWTQAAFEHSTRTSFKILTILTRMFSGRAPQGHRPSFRWRRRPPNRGQSVHRHAGIDSNATKLECNRDNIVEVSPPQSVPGVYDVR